MNSSILGPKTYLGNILNSMIGFVPEHDATIVLPSHRQDDTGWQRNTITVSYTHLTLPTIYSV